ncbi:MAG: hypothetical protein JNK65_03660 [Deltaproteobacteria bacterium]|nr:hypothetical protein [Deltaproteobacteria bacterium]
MPGPIDSGFTVENSQPDSSQYTKDAQGSNPKGSGNWSSFFNNVVAPTGYQALSQKFQGNQMGTAVLSAVTGGAPGMGGRASIVGPGGGGTGSTGMYGNVGGPSSFGPPPPPMFGGAGGQVGGNTFNGIGSNYGGVDQYQGQLDNMFNNNMQFLMMQTKVQNMSQQIQVASNIIKTRDDAIANTIRNFKS